jgi:hypothetical protein
MLLRASRGQRIVTSANDVDLNAVVPVPDFSTGSLMLVVDRIERSSRFQHYILRADELDAIWRHIEEARKTAHLQPAGVDIEQLERLQAAVLEAHELVDNGSPHEAAARLREAIRAS